MPPLSPGLRGCGRFFLRYIRKDYIILSLISTFPQIFRLAPGGYGRELLYLGPSDVENGMAGLLFSYCTERPYDTCWSILTGHRTEIDPFQSRNSPEYGDDGDLWPSRAGVCFPLQMAFAAGDLFHDHQRVDGDGDGLCHEADRR